MRGRCSWTGRLLLWPRAALPRAPRPEPTARHPDESRLRRDEQRRGHPDHAHRVRGRAPGACRIRPAGARGRDRRARCTDTFAAPSTRTASRRRCRAWACSVTCPRRSTWSTRTDARWRGSWTTSPSRPTWPRCPVAPGTAAGTASCPTTPGSCGSIERHADPEATLAGVLEPVAELFGVSLDVLPAAARVDDTAGATIAVALPLPPGRERPCEIITPPLVAGHRDALEQLLAPARDLGFTVPKEAAVHVHLDAAPFRSPHAFANLVRLFGHWREVAVVGAGHQPGLRAARPAAAGSRGPRRGALGADWSSAAGRGAVDGADQVRRRQPHAARQPRVRCATRWRCGSCPAGSTPTRSWRQAAVVEALLRRCLDPRPLPLPGAGAEQDPLAALDDLLAVVRR